MLIVTTESIKGKDIVETIGYVKGSSVRAKGVGSDMLAGFKGFVGGEISQYTDMMDESRKIAVARMVEETEAKGANAIVGMRFVSSTIAQGASEITVYGTAVVIGE